MRNLAAALCLFVFSAQAASASLMAGRIVGVRVPLHYAIDAAERAVAAVHKGEISQETLNTIMTGLQKRMGLSMSDFLATDVGKIFLRPAPADLYTRIEMRKAATRNEVEEPWDKNARDTHADALMKLAVSKLGNGMTLDQALTAAMKERPDLLERSKTNSLKRYY
jgi:hypothetical protein